MIDKLLARGDLGRGAAIGFISSAAGLGWEANLPLLKEYLDITDFDAAAQWAQEHGKADYMWSKQAICAYVAREAMSFLKQGIRINAICPGPTDTPLAQANKDMWLGFGSDYRDEVGVEAATPLEQAYPLVFLCSDAAGAITGQTIITDSGYFASGVTETFPDATPAVQLPPRPLLNGATRTADEHSSRVRSVLGRVLQRPERGVPAPPRRSAGVLQRAVRVLRAVALRRRAGGAPRLGDVLERARHRPLDALEGLGADPELQEHHHDGPARARPAARAREPRVHAEGRRPRSSR